MNELIELNDIEKVKNIISENKNNWIKLIKDSKEILLNMEMKDRLNGINAYLKGKKNCEQVRIDIWQVEEWNKKKIGEHLLKLKEDGLLKAGGINEYSNLDSKKILLSKDLNLSKNDSSKFQNRANISDNEYQELLDECEKCRITHSCLYDKNNKKG